LGTVVRKFITQSGEVIEHPTEEQIKVFNEKLAYLISGFWVWQEKERAKQNRGEERTQEFLSVMVG